MESDKILQYNNICTKCHLLLDDNHQCVDEKVICPRFYTYEEMTEMDKRRKTEYVYIRKAISRPKTR